MRLREIEIRDFRKLRSASIKGLVDGVNVIAGNNEAGKSTVLSGLQTAFFQRHNISGKLLESIQPYGCSVRPEVDLSFEIDGLTYRLQKTFAGSSGKAELTCPDGKRFMNHDADRKLEELLRFQGSAKGAAKFQELGMWPLFWVEQGTMFQGMNINPDVRATVQSSLRKEVGDILVGEAAARLRNRIGVAYREYFTEKTGKPCGVLSAAEKYVRDLQLQLAAKRAELATFNASIEALESNLAKLAELRCPEVRMSLERDLKEADEAVRCAEGLLQQRQNTEQQLNLAQVVLRHAGEAVSRRQERAAELAGIEKELKELRDKQVRAEEELHPLEEQFTQSSSDLGEMRKALLTATATSSAASRIYDFLTAKQQHDRESERFRRAQTAAGEVRAAETTYAAIRISDADLKKLRSLDGEVAKAEARLESAATKLEFRLSDAEGVRFNGGPLPAENPVVLTDSAVIEIPNRGSFRILPGGDTLADRRSELERARSNVAKSLSVARTPSIADAEEAFRLKQEAGGTLKSQREMLSALAPEGITELEQVVRSLADRVTSLSEGIDLSTLPDSKTADIRRRETASDVQGITSKLRESELHLERLRVRRDGAREVLTTTTGEFRNASGAFDRNSDALSAERQKASDLDLQSKLDAARKAEAGLLEAFTEANARYLAADPDVATERVQMTKTALANLDSETQRLEKTVERLRGSLETQGKAGPGEQCAALEADLNNATIRYTSLDRDAQSLRLLYQTILDTERDANTQFLQPVVERVQPYLRRVLPGARVRFSADLAIEGLDRGQTTEPFSSLSVGAREQVSVLTRIAFADLLASEGVAAPIILDDALVYSDNTRFSDTLLALSLAARRHQIIILTCHEDRYLKLGAPTIHLEDCLESEATTAIA
jgi:uncharacterized protein YhaN